MVEVKEVLLNRMLNNISDEYDKTTGSFFYDTIKPVAIELETLHEKADDILDKCFVDTCEGDYLDRKCSEQGLYRKQATKSTGKVKVTGIIGSKVKKGNLVSSDNVNFIFQEDKIIDETKQAIILVQCEECGIIGNVPVGAIKYFPKTLEGLHSVYNEDPLNNGYEVENDSSLRERYYTKVKTPATSGNKYHYLNWSKEVTGVGDAKIIPLAYGPGTVKVVIINSNKTSANTDLIEKVFQHIEENRPIGATVTVISAIEKTINIVLNLVIDSKSYLLDDVKLNLEKNITEYLKEIAFNQNYVSYAKIGNIIFDTDGVLDYNNLKINDTTSNIIISDEEVAVLGGVAIE